MLELLLQTTIEGDPDDWHIGRFSQLSDFVSNLRGEDGSPAVRVTARDRARRGAPDPVLSTLDETPFDRLWLFAVDTGDGLTAADCAGIGRFRRAGGSVMVTRDHMDLGSSICTLGDLGVAHHFHSRNAELDERRHRIDDVFTTAISWPNYHSGANGDFQRVRPVGDLHPVARDEKSETGAVRYLPAHPHEGAVSAPLDDPSARVVLEGQSAVSGRPFIIAVAFERSERGGRALAQSTFHHFADFNWAPAAGSPSFVTETPGDGMARYPEAFRSTRQYVRNVAFWLAGRA